MVICKIYYLFYRKDSIVEVQENSSINNNNILNNDNNIIDNEINNQYINPNLPQQQIVEKYEDNINNQINNNNNNNIENNNDNNIINNEDNL